MAATSAVASEYASTAADTAYTLSSSTSNLDWGSKGCTFLLFVSKYS